MTAIKVLAIDLDHTLLASDWSLSQRNRSAIMSAASNGIKIVLATGRMPLATMRYAFQLAGTVSYVVCYNGALVLDLDEQATMMSTTVPADSWRAIVSFANRHCCRLAFFNYDRVSSSVRPIREDLVLRHYQKRTGATINAAIDIPSDPAFHKIIIYHNSLASKYDPNQETPLEQQLHSALAALNIPDVIITKTRLGYVECTAKTVGKLAAMEFILHHLGYSTRNLMAIGDGYNDAALISVARVGVAVGNAVSACREAADLVVGSNDADGVAQAIEEVIHGRVSKLD